MSDTAGVELQLHLIIKGLRVKSGSAAGVMVCSSEDREQIVKAILAAGFGPVQEARAEAWDEGRADGPIIAESTDGGNNYTFRRGTNPYRTEASS